MLAIAAQTAGPNWLNPLSTPGVKKAKKKIKKFLKIQFEKAWDGIFYTPCPASFLFPACS